MVPVHTVNRIPMQGALEPYSMEMFVWAKECTSGPIFGLMSRMYSKRHFLE